MSLKRKLKNRGKRRALRVRSGLQRGTAGRPRVSIFRSLSHIYAQVIDDTAGITLTSCSSLELKKLAGDKTAVSRAVGLELAKRAREKKVEAVSFDRGKYRFHGRVQAVAEGLREGGVEV